MLIFKDLEFKSNKKSGVGAAHTFDNGITISIQGGSSNWSTPRENLTSPNEFTSFEVAVLDENKEFITKKFIKNNDDDVMGWMDRADISILMIKIQFDK
tara:strand:- start:125 stop:421 length:297 start_codon:yes stop_codon:yes gene_type:complete